jgi:hypothetical protein
MSLFNEEQELELFDNQLKQLINNEQPCIKHSNLKISIMSATSEYNSILNLKALSLFLKTNDNIFFIDSTFNMTRKISNISKKKIFYNQITLKIRPYYNVNLKINLNLVVNMKLFRNGKLQLCGLRSEYDGYLSLVILKTELNNIINKQVIQINILKNKFKTKFLKKIIDNLCYKNNYYLLNYDSIINIINKNNLYNKYIKQLNFSPKVLKKLLQKNQEIIKIIRYNITLINSDFYVGFKLNRSKVYDFALNTCNLFCDYDPCIYQGVLLKFYWNNLKDIQNGICNCSVPCNGKGIGYGNGECKKITISIFQSGNIIITGKTIRTEINYIYNYIVKLFQENFDELRQYLLINKTEKIKRRNMSLLIKKY